MPYMSVGFAFIAICCFVFSGIVYLSVKYWSFAVNLYGTLIVLAALYGIGCMSEAVGRWLLLK